MILLALLIFVVSQISRRLVSNNSPRHTLQEEELVISDRTDVLDTDAIAIIIEEYPSENFPGAGDGCRYQFIYPGDQVYVMNSNGATIEVVK